MLKALACGMAARTALASASNSASPGGTSSTEILMRPVSANQASVSRGSFGTKPHSLRERGVAYRSPTEQMDATTPHGELLFSLFGALA